ncbi:hypothetical protein IE53DRAFT_370240 [Violaceomyces palustris]|uniref:Uncharacterized protein n=1 Tax=Violaceomyces palustris TaxID=1673888 RepID=A0ACD0NST6_9BASI|nr:hypothetical protein IE53DRAFT_370240 [Violaceomyces palustris]
MVGNAMQAEAAKNTSKAGTSTRGELSSPPNSISSSVPSKPKLSDFGSLLKRMTKTKVKQGSPRPIKKSEVILEDDETILELDDDRDGSSTLAGGVKGKEKSSLEVEEMADLDDLGSKEEGKTTGSTSSALPDQAASNYAKEALKKDRKMAKLEAKALALNLGQILNHPSLLVQPVDALMMSHTRVYELKSTVQKPSNLSLGG